MVPRSAFSRLLNLHGDRAGPLVGCTESAETIKPNYAAVRVLPCAPTGTMEMVVVWKSSSRRCDLVEHGLVSRPLCSPRPRRYAWAWRYQQKDDRRPSHLLCLLRTMP
jgi:hypothetical protein